MSEESTSLPALISWFGALGNIVGPENGNLLLFRGLSLLMVGEQSSSRPYRGRFEFELIIGHLMEGEIEAVGVVYVEEGSDVLRRVVQQFVPTQ